MVGPERKTIALTVDLEEWTVPQEFGGEPLSEKHSIGISEQGTYRLLEILEQESIKVTFFVTAFFASRKPEIMKKIVELGHETASHGLRHSPLKNQTYVEQLASLREAGKIIEKKAGSTPIGFRAPTLRIDGATIKALKKLNYFYDSSILATYVPGRYNQLRAPYMPFIWGETGQLDIAKPLLEIPISVTPILRVPIGWWWFRKNFGQRACQLGFHALWRRNQPVVCVVHPWELVKLPSAPSIPFHIRFNCGERSIEQLESLINHVKKVDGKFVTMSWIANQFYDGV
nr:polysaccharide deacetylase family protein [Candidatus Njordarchaeum guaymaensis]